MSYKEEDLPTVKDIFLQLKSLRDVQEPEINDIITWTYDKIEILKEVTTNHLKLVDYSPAPEMHLNRLLKFHEINGSMLGFVKGLCDRAQYLTYRRYTEESRKASAVKEQKLTAGDRDVYSKGEHADLEGLKRDLEETQKNLWERISVARGAVRKF